MRVHHHNNLYAQELLLQLMKDVHVSHSVHAHEVEIWVAPLAVYLTCALCFDLFRDVLLIGGDRLEKAVCGNVPRLDGQHGGGERAGFLDLQSLAGWQEYPSTYSRLAEAKACRGIGLEGAIRQAKNTNGTSEGRRTWQTLLTATAFPAGDFDDENASRSISAKRKAAALGVREQSWKFAVERVHRLSADLHPTEVAKKGLYWFLPRTKRSDAASEELNLLMRQYWHSDEVSRASGNLASRDMWKASKSPGAEIHPRRQLTEPGGGDAVYAKFPMWADYRSYKSRQGGEFADPGRTLFLSTQCKGLTLPIMEQCASKIHSH